MSKNVISLLLFFSMLIGVISSAFAVTIESEEIRLGINGYINLLIPCSLLQGCLDVLS